LTAAHCLDIYSKVFIQAGVHNRTDSKEVTQQTRTSRSFIVHEEWDRDWLRNDIGLVFLNEPFQLIPGLVETVELSNAEAEVGMLVTAAGWGKDHDGPNNGTDVPHKVELEVIDKDEIDVNKYPPRTDLETHSCIISLGGHNTCFGDSGGPYMSTEGGIEQVGEGRESKWLSFTLDLQVGITSFGGLRCENGVPGCFTDLGFFYDWVQDHLP